MADQIPLKVIRTLGDTTALGEFEIGEEVGLAHGGTGADNAADARTNLDVPPNARDIISGDGLAGGGDLSADRTLSVNVQNSIEIDTDILQLVNDEASPGNNQVYGTDGAGAKGWKADPAGGGGDPDQNLWETITSDSGSAVANTITDTLTIAGGAGISTAIVGDTITITASGGSHPVSLSTINSQLVITFVDTTRSSKVLSVAELSELWGRKKVDAGDWLKIGDANSADNGWLMPLDGTVVRCATLTTNNGGDNSGVDLYINGVLSTANIGVITGAPSGAEQDVQEDLNINFSQGDILNLRCITGASSEIVDINSALFVRWRA